MSKIEVGVIGATGYAGQQLISLLSVHPNVEISFLSSNSYAGMDFTDIYPMFEGVMDMPLISTEQAKEAVSTVDVVFTALPNGLVFEIADLCMKAGTKLIDFSADFRLDDVEVYKLWYKTEHTATHLMPEQIYGLPELWRDKIAGAKLIANPGCYTTASILAIAPLVGEKNLIDVNNIIIDAKSGVTGAGRKKDTSLLYAEAGESIKAYGIANHRHTPEIEQELSKIYGEELVVQFTPHLMPMKRGILATVYLNTLKPVTEEEIYTIYEKKYGHEKFIRLRRGLCETRFVEHTNFCDIGICYDDRTKRLIVTSAIDNLMKGAASQAVQNMNIICDLREDAGLDILGIIAP